MLSHSVTLSWRWANQSIPYPNNAEHQARKWQVSICKVFGLTRPGFEPAGFRLETLIFGFPVLPEWAAGTLLIWPPGLVSFIVTVFLTSISATTLYNYILPFILYAIYVSYAPLDLTWLCFCSPPWAPLQHGGGSDCVDHCLLKK